MTWEKETQMKFLVVGMDSSAPDLMPIQGYFSDDEIKSCPRCGSQFKDGDEVRLVSHPFMSFGWYEQRLKHSECPEKVEADVRREEIEEPA